MTGTSKKPLPSILEQAVKAKQAILDDLGFMPETIKPSGKWERFSTHPNKPKDTSGRYSAHIIQDSRLLVNYMDMRQGAILYTFVYRGKGETFTVAQKQSFKAEAERARKEVEKERTAQHNGRAKDVHRILSKYSTEPDSGHAYAKKKGFTAEQLKDWGIRSNRYNNEHTLLVPLQDIDGNIWNVQKIYEHKLPSGTDKMNTRGARIEGCFHPFGDISNGENPLLIAEGFATAASVYMATGYPTVSCCSAGNLLKVAEAFRGRYPDREIIMMADNDIRAPGSKISNTGVVKAREAAEQFGGKVAIPKPLYSPAGEQRATDWDDVRRNIGLDTIRKTVENVLHGKQENTFDGKLIPVDTVESVPVPWLWQGWLMRQGVNMIAGRGGIAKSTLVLNLCVTVAKGGTFPDGTSCRKGKVLYYANEDDIAIFHRPRLEAMGWTKQDGNIYFLDRENFDPQTDMHELKQMVEYLGGVDLVVFDPIISIVNGDNNKATDVRSSMRTITDIAMDYGFAVIGIHHVTKDSRNRAVSDRLIGSSAWRDYSRVVLTCSMYDGETDHCAIAMDKCNYAEQSGGFDYNIIPIVLPANDDHDEIETVAVRWGDRLTGTASDIMAEVEAKEASKGAMEEIEEFIIDLIDRSPNGKCLGSVMNEEREQMGFSYGTFISVRKKLRADGYIDCRKGDRYSEERLQDQWYWRRTSKPHPSKMVHKTNG